MSLHANELPSLAEKLESSTPQEILEWALKSSEKIAISFSGAEDVVLIDMATKIDPKVKVITLDTGRLHPETYEFFDWVRDHYNIPIEAYFPQPEAVQRLVAEKGFNSFYKDGHTECCEVRKMEPLRRALSSLDTWITGQRKDQSPTRKNVPVVQLDTVFGTPEKPLVKFNPLTNWTTQQVWRYIIDNNVPFSKLHQTLVNAGGDYTEVAIPLYVSIGCAPCTRLREQGEHERAGRWWWEPSTQKECGLHASNVK